MQIGQKKTTGQKMKKERNRGRETDRKPNISQIQKTGEHCIYAKRCGGCDYQGILYSQQLSKKQSYMRKLMEPFGKINPIIGMDDPYHYRHKVQAAFSCNKRGHIVAGVYEKHSHDIVDVEECQIEDAQADAMVAMAKNPNGGMNSMAGMGMQMSAGMAFGGMMAGQMNGGVQGQSGTHKESFVICPKCGSEMKKGLKFCSECGASLVVQKKKCIKCGAEINADMKFCPECGTNQAQPVCPKCGYKAAAGQKFCPECGTSLL